MSESLERRFGVLEYLELRLHLLVCAWCTKYFKQIKFLRQLMRPLASRPAQDCAMPVGLSSEARERIANALSQHHRHSLQSSDENSCKDV